MPPVPHLCEAPTRKGSTMSHPFGRNRGRIVSTKWFFHTKGSMDSLTSCWLSYA